MKKDKCREKKYLFVGLVIVLSVGAFFRFYQIKERGLILWDEAYYLSNAKFGVSIIKNIPFIYEQFLYSDDLNLDLLKETLQGYPPFTNPKPVHGALMTIFAILTGGDVKDYTGSMYSAFFGILVITLIFVVGKVFFDSWVGLIATLLASVSTYHIMYARSAMAETDSSFFFLLGILLYYLSHKRSKKIFLFLAGLSLGISITANYRWIFLVSIPFLVEVGLAFFSKDITVGQSVKRFLMLFISLVSIPLFIQMAFLFVNMFQPIPYENYFSLIRKFYGRHVSSAAMIQPHSLFLQLITNLEGFLFLIFLLIGVGYGLRRHMVQDLLILLPFLIPFAAFSLKYRGDKAEAISIALPFMSLIVGNVIVRIPDFIARVLGLMRKNPLVIAIPIILASWLVMQNAIGSWRLIKIKSGYREAIEWIKEKNGENHFTTAHSITGFYVGDRGKARYSPETLEEMRELYEKEGFRYLLLDWKMKKHPNEINSMIEKRYKPVRIVPNRIASYLPYIIDDFHYRHKNPDYVYNIQKDPDAQLIRIYDLKEFFEDGSE